MLTETKPVPRAWFPEMRGAEVLCLASGGGQQAPVFAAAGAKVTVLDNSPEQLAQDRLVAEREALDLRTVQGDMSGPLVCFADESFDLVFHPVSNLFVPEVRPVWSGGVQGAAARGDPARRFSEPRGLHLRPGARGQPRAS